MPAAASARTADSRPEPGPCTRTSTDFKPYWSRAVPAAESEACCAAYGVPFRDPLNPIAPAEDQHSTRPSGSVMVICVLLNDASIFTTPCATTRRSRFFLNSFLRFAAASGFAGAPVSGAAPWGSLATVHSVLSAARIQQLEILVRLRPPAASCASVHAHRRKPCAARPRQDASKN